MAYKRGNYTADHKGVAGFLKSHQLSKATKSVANQIATTARRIAPVSDDHDDGHYVSGIVVERIDNAGVKGDRIGYEVVATAGHPTLVEWGRSPGEGHPGYPGFHVMQRAAEEVSNR